MNKITLLFLVLLGFITSCSSDDDDKSGVNSSIIIDGMKFTPNKGLYYYQTASFDSQKKVVFLISNEKEDENFYIDIAFLSSQKDLSGIYDFGPGTANELLVSCELITSKTRYSIQGYTLKLTDLGDSKFSFEFTNPVAAFDIVKNKQVSFKGGLEGKFEFTVIKE
ncbi:hypothetical protein [Flavobacterium bizetiae]|uniref:hypothetical protein n=1 Tax=Flavobacterium bizetiae TaxID=2704140 RepID=UPI003756B176